MTNISRVRIGWHGAATNDGVSTFYALDGPALIDDLWAFFTAIKGVLPGGVTLAFPGEGDVIDPLNGDLVNSWTMTAGASIDGTYTGSCAGPAGAVINWLTGTVMNGHRLRGKTYLVPLGADVYQNDGTINPDELAGLRSHAGTFVASAADNFVIWNRPKGEQAGGYAVVTSTQVKDHVAVLRSRAR